MTREQQHRRGHEWVGLAHVGASTTSHGAASRDKSDEGDVESDGSDDSADSFGSSVSEISVSDEVSSAAIMHRQLPTTTTDTTKTNAISVGAATAAAAAAADLNSSGGAERSVSERALNAAGAVEHQRPPTTPAGAIAVSTRADNSGALLSSVAQRNKIALVKSGTQHRRPPGTVRGRSVRPHSATATLEDNASSSAPVKGSGSSGAVSVETREKSKHGAQEATAGRARTDATTSSRRGDNKDDDDGWMW